MKRDVLQDGKWEDAAHESSARLLERVSKKKGQNVKRDDRWNSDKCFLEPMEVVTRIEHKSLKECQEVSGVVPSARICEVSQQKRTKKDNEKKEKKKDGIV